ncbi:glutamate racemase [Pseudoalteromonas sp. T1lg65]|uniref:glutamate racemase n=1 Tax=Pseudoalteromonas sp. T1lg65 TaxID=2077101 RepID=UPI003F7AD280
MPRILVFDSGIGGTSVLSHIRQKLPNATYGYVMDNALLPYGLQPQEVIKARIRGLVQWQKRCEPSVDVIVIACNTASTYALDEARKHTDIPVVGVVPAIKPAAASSKTKHITLLATPATSKNAYTKKLIEEFAADCKVTILHSTELVKLAEQLYWYGEVDTLALSDEIERLGIPKETDQLILGCTHFPLLSELISRCVDPKIRLIDSGEAIANRVSYLLNENMKADKGSVPVSVDFYATEPVGSSIQQVKLITLESD